MYCFLQHLDLVPHGGPQITRLQVHSCIDVGPIINRVQSRWTLEIPERKVRTKAGECWIKKLRYLAQYGRIEGWLLSQSACLSPLPVGIRMPGTTVHFMPPLHATSTSEDLLWLEFCLRHCKVMRFIFSRHFHRPYNDVQHRCSLGAASEITQVDNAAFKKYDQCNTSPWSKTCICPKALSRSNIFSFRLWRKSCRTYTHSVTKSTVARFRILDLTTQSICTLSVDGHKEFSCAKRRTNKTRNWFIHWLWKRGGQNRTRET